MNGHTGALVACEDRPYGTIAPDLVSGEGAALSDAPAAFCASLFADETAALACIVTGLRALRPDLAHAAAIDALGTPASYRLATEMMDALIGDLSGMLDTRDFADMDARGRAA